MIVYTYSAKQYGEVFTNLSAGNFLEARHRDCKIKQYNLGNGQSHKNTFFSLFFYKNTIYQ